jgi:MFS family permease
VSARLLDPAHRAFTVGIVAVMTMFAFEGIGVGTAMPVVATALDGLGSYAWAFGGYVVASLVGLVLAGEWADARGPRQPLIVGVGLFALGALLCGAAWSMPALIAGRLVEGLGGGIGIVAVYVILGRAFDDRLRPQAFVLLSTAWVLPAIVGPFVAGFLTDQVSWRAVFWLVVPLVLPPVWLLAPRLGRLGGGSGAADRGDSRRRLRLAVVAAAGLALLQEGAARVGRTGALLAVAGLAVVAPALGRLLPHGTWRFARGLPAVVMMRGLMAGAFFGGESFVPLALQTERGLTPTHAGLILTAGALGWTTGAWVQGRKYASWGPVRLLRIGTLCATTGLATVPLCLLPQVSPYTAALSWVVGSIGMGLSFGTLGNETLALSAPADQGENSAALQLCDSTGSVLLIGLAGAVYATAVAAGNVDRLTFTVIFLTMAAVMALGVAMSGRVRGPRAVVPTTTVAA